MRYAGYKATIYFLFGKLGKGKRIRLPSCVGKTTLQSLNVIEYSPGQKLRETYPNPPGFPYVGYKDYEAS